MNKLELFGRYLKVGLSAISFLAEKDAASIPNAGYSISDSNLPSSESTRTAAASSMSFHFLTSVNFFCKWDRAEVFFGYILSATADLFISGGQFKRNAFAFITANLAKITKTMNHNRCQLNYLTYICGSIGFSHYTRLKKLSMPNNETEVRSGEFVWHFDFYTSY